MHKICLYGASGHGKVIKDLIKSTNKDVAVFIDDNPAYTKIHDSLVLNSKYINDYQHYSFIISIGNNEIRKRISKKINVNFTKIIHKNAIVSPYASIAEGTVVMAGAILNSDVHVKKHCIVNTNAVIEHDCTLDNFVHISPNAVLAGNVKVGEGTHVGVGASVIPNITIGKWVTIGAGAVVIKNIPDYAVVVGNPGAVIKFSKIHEQ